MIRPILFSAPMVIAILEGRKSQTRRIVKPDKSWVKYHDGNKVAAFTAFHRDSSKPWNCGGINWQSGNELLTPNFQIGDTLWVRETFRLSDANDCACYEPCNCKIGSPIYRATCGFDREEETDPPWKPSIFMPKALSRITLEITGVRVERLQDITEDDAKAEGIIRVEGTSEDEEAQTNVDAYRVLWESINGPGSWAKNNFVWVLTFKRIKP
jgi:hypothetical protein